MSRRTVTVIFFALLTLGGCGQPKDGVKTQESAAPKQSISGSDRDAHGCIGSAGYHWCEKLDKCVRPWELAEKEGFEKSAKAFESFCQTK